MIFVGSLSPLRGGGLSAQQPSDIAAAVEDAEYEDLVSLDPVEDHVPLDDKAAQTGPQIIAGPAQPGMSRQKIKPLRDRGDESVGGRGGACRRIDVIPYLVEIGARLGRETCGSAPGF